MICEIRQCSVCKANDFTSCLDKFSTRRYKHGKNWQNRCKFFKENPNASLSDAKEIGEDK